MPTADPTAGGLRERKKARTRASIQAHALRLFRERGYEATTVQQIIEAAEVSESTFFRYFPTKADVVLTDDFDPLLIEAFRRQPPGVGAVRALRGAIATVAADLTPDERAEQRERTALVLSVPELRSSMMDQLASALTLVAELVAERAGRARDDVEVEAVAGAVIGASIAAGLAVADDPAADMWSRLDETLACLEAGWTL